MTEVIAQSSDALPWFVAFSNSASVEEAEEAEYIGPVTAAVEQPEIFRVTAQVVITGEAFRTFTWSSEDAIDAVVPSLITDLFVIRVP